MSHQSFSAAYLPCIASSFLVSSLYFLPHPDSKYFSYHFLSFLSCYLFSACITPFSNISSLYIFCISILASLSSGRSAFSSPCSYSCLHIQQPQQQQQLYTGPFTLIMNDPRPPPSHANPGSLTRALQSIQQSCV